MKQPLILWITALAMVSFYNCQPKEELAVENPDAQLDFFSSPKTLQSGDTVSFDTLLTTRGSITRRLKVYNRNSHALKIEKINIGQGENSLFTMMVNGREGSQFSEITLPGGDSLLVLLKITIDPSDKDLPFLIKDSIEFHTYKNYQKIKLTAWGQDAHFMKDSVISENTVWSGNRPYVILNNLRVDSTATLTIEKGVRVFFDNRSGMLVQGNLIVKGTAEERVTFRNVRVSQNPVNIFGQWNGITFTKESKDNIIDFAVIQYAEDGLRINPEAHPQSPKLKLTNTIIHNMLVYGITGSNSNLAMQNVLIYNCREGLFSIQGGGNYEFLHCSFFENEYRPKSIVQLSSTAVNANNAQINNPLLVKMYNTVVWGRQQEEIDFGKDESMLSLDWGHNLIKSKQIKYSVNNNILFSGNYTEMYFKDMYYRPDQKSPLVDKAKVLLVEKDLDGLTRDQKPDIGAYEWREEKKVE